MTGSGVAPDVARDATRGQAPSLAAILLAGGPARDDLAEPTGATHKALVPVAGRSLLERTLEALLQSQRVSSVVIVSPEEAASLPEVNDAKALWVDSGDSLVENLLRGLDAVPEAERALAVSADLPLLKAEEVDDFVEQASCLEADFVYSMVEREVCETAFPGTERTYVTVRDGTFTGGNLMLIARATAQEHADLIRDVFALRKKPLKLCRLLGWTFLVRLLCRRLRAEEVVKRVGEILNCRTGVVRAGASIAFDVDKVADLELAEELLSGER